MHMVELLAPVGNIECLKAAINAGCDAVYLAGRNFGARSFAGNFSNEELIEAMEFYDFIEKSLFYFFFFGSGSSSYIASNSFFRSALSSIYRLNADSEVKEAFTVSLNPSPEFLRKSTENQRYSEPYASRVQKNSFP